ncbi:MAG TPA: response regulator transcription factor [Ilumatobacteraceae bacterium]|nr:response regulator transcription factor [Ilumatobacteraceae bacterium]
MNADVLVVEDAPEFARVVSTVLENAGHLVRLANTMAKALIELDLRAPDVVILDLGLPDGDGLDLCRMIRERSSAYVLMLTGRDDELDKLLGFRLGADDYVTKPFSARELAARVDALMRRPRAEVGSDAVRVFDDLTIDTSAREVAVGGVMADLTRIEFDLLDVLSASPKVVFNRQQLLDRVWGPGWHGDDHVVDVHIANLRKKIDRPDAKSWVRTVRGVGYAMGN